MRVKTTERQNQSQFCIFEVVYFHISKHSYTQVKHLPSKTSKKIVFEANDSNGKPVTTFKWLYTQFLLHNQENPSIRVENYTLLISPFI